MGYIFEVCFDFGIFYIDFVVCFDCIYGFGGSFVGFDFVGIVIDCCMEVGFGIIKICNRISMEGIKVKIYFKDIVYLEVK